MNIVKGVADLIRRSSGGQPGESPSVTHVERFSAPSPKICFSEAGDEAILNTLWLKYENADDKAEKRKFLHVFLKQFIVVFKDWSPVASTQSESPFSTIPASDYSSCIDDTIFGCSFGHPAEIILTLIEEVAKLTALTIELNSSMMQSITSVSGNSGIRNLMSEWLPVLDGLTIVTRSVHNCRVFGYYGGIQRLVALLKAAVVQLKTMTGALSADENLSIMAAEKTRFLQKVLVYVVSLVCSFIELNANAYKKAQVYSAILEFAVPGRGADVTEHFDSSFHSSEVNLHWHHKAVVSVMEAGGLNWLVELVRVIRRLSMKEQWTDMALQYLSLRTLHTTLFDNMRGQSHFRSIGGLEVLLDGPVLPSSSTFKSLCDEQRNDMALPSLLELHVLSLKVLREAVFGSLNNLQFLCENGRIHKLANSFCSPAFMLQDYKSETKNLMREEWSAYVSKLSGVLCSFLFTPEDVKCPSPEVSSSKVLISSAYSELSIKWILRVLNTVFPCIKACSTQSTLPHHLRVFVDTLQLHTLGAFQALLALSPFLLEVLREEGLWDLIFSENFFYFGPTLEESLDEHSAFREGSKRKLEVTYSFTFSGNVKAHDFENLQADIISFVEFAATSNGSAHNLPECSVLLDALEQSACNPEIACVLAKSLLHVLQLSTEKTVISLKTLNAMPRVLKVACIQAQEYRRLCTLHDKTFHAVTPVEKIQISGRNEQVQIWLKTMQISTDLFTEYFSIAEDAKVLVLRSSVCVDYLFDLFWEEGFRNSILTRIIELLKIKPASEEDQKAKLQLCSRYMETLNQIKEKERYFCELSMDLLVGIRDMLLLDQKYYQDLFRDAECFLHIVSLLNGSLDESNAEKLVLNVLQTITCLLANNDSCKTAFRLLVGKGYQTLQSLLLDFCQWQPNEKLLNALLDMLVDGKFDIKVSPIIKNEDVIVLYLSVLQKSSDSLQQHGLDLFQQLLRDSMSNRASCVRAGMLSLLLDWFSQENNGSVTVQIAQLVQVIGGHSISGKDIRKIFALLRSERVVKQQHYCSLLLSSVLSMLNEKGPTAFFDMDGVDSGVNVNTPLQWPLNKGFSFTCWLRVENFPRTGTLGLFKFLTDNGKGCYAVLAKDKLIYESLNLKRQLVSLNVNLVRRKWHFVCLTHSIGRTFSGGSQLKCYVDGALVSTERCRYAKVNEPISSCSIGAKIKVSSCEEETAYTIKDSSPFLGQIGPVYLFNDAISSEQVQGLHVLGPSYMYSFLDNNFTLFSDHPLPGSILDAKDGLATKLIFGINAQASDGKTLFNVSSVSDHIVKATVLAGTQLCSRRLLQQIIYCVGGVSVFFPLIAQSDKYDDEERADSQQALLGPVSKERLTAEVIELVASVLDENIANQQQMHLLSGFPILGFLLQSVPPQQLNLETLSALKLLFNIIVNSGLSELLVKDVITSIFLNPLIWVYTGYKVQRELYMFLIQQFDNDPRLLKSLCRIPRVIDIVRQFYWDVLKTRNAAGAKPLLNPLTKQVIGERPCKEDIHKIRLLLLSLGEMSLRQNILPSDVKALIAFFESSQDMACVEDVLHMVIRAISQKQVLASFLEQVNVLGGCHVFLNLLQRDHEPIRLLSLQFIGRLLVGIPSEKKGARFFSLAVGRSKATSDSQRKINVRMQPIYSAISDRIFRFQQTDNLCATLFDVLLGGASPKQVLQKHNQIDKQKTKGNSSHFLLPQILALIFRFLSDCNDQTSRIKIIRDLLHLFDSNTSNIEALMEFGWTPWLASFLKLDVIKDYSYSSQVGEAGKLDEKLLVRNIFCIALSHYLCSVKGGWQHLEETINFLLMHCENMGIPYKNILRDMYDDIVKRLLSLSSDESILISQPCRDNALFLLRLVDETLVCDIDHKLPFPASGFGESVDSINLESQKDLASALSEDLLEEFDYQIFRDQQNHKQPITLEDDLFDDMWWSFFDNLWILISEIYGKGPSKMLPKASSSVGPTIGQRARGLVESLNIPAAEMAAVVVSGGIGNALSGKPNKNVDKAMLLRGEKFPKIVFRLVVLYLCKSSLERASRCVQQVISLLPCLLAADDEPSKSRFQLFVWALLSVRSQYGMLEDGARFHVVSHLIRETLTCGKCLLALSIVSMDDSSDHGNSVKETSVIHNLIQADKVLSAITDEAKYIRNFKAERSKHLLELSLRLDENASAESAQKKAFEDEMHVTLNAILASDENRRAAFQLAHDEDQQIAAEKWIRMFRTLIDERGPWSANPFPNKFVVHWKLDKTEDAWRRRQKLRRNYYFDEKLCHPPSTDAIILVNENKPSFGGHISEQMKKFLLKGIHKITDEGGSDLSENNTDSTGQNDSVSEDRLETSQSGTAMDGNSQNDITRENTQEAETEVLMSLPCVVVTSKRKVGGHLAIKKDVLHFFGEFLVEGTGGSSVFNKFNSSSNSDGSKPDQVGGPQKQRFLKLPTDTDMDSEWSHNVDPSRDGMIKTKSKKTKRHRRWNTCKIRAVHWTRYLLRYTAIEIFFNDSVAPVFLNFASQNDAKNVGSLIVATRNESLYPKGSNKDKSGHIQFVDKRVALEMAEVARESWRRREMSNFEYLMILNTLAGRSYNDLTQYPVFPWVLADYVSDTLDFNKSSTFRDLSKPVGALDSKRFEVFEDRYRNFSDPDIPSFYYGSHYSSMGIVLYYLLRLEPFTGLHRNLQGGKFDHADRLFHSIEGTYRNCLSNTSDVKELIPEFFYMPEFLSNLNKYHFGVKQDGEPIGDICLPPWAKGSPEEFVNRNREALESEYVSSNLHNWIDLIFGYKQRGKPAVEAANIFYYLTYEGAVDMDSMEDELQKSAIEDQIANFGQTPIQIFRKKHPRRGPPIPIAHPLYFAPGSINLTSIVSSVNHPPSAVLYISLLDSNIVHVNQGLSMSVKLWLTTQMQSGGNFTFSGLQDLFFGIGSDILSPRKIGSPVAENIELGAQCFATLRTSSENFLVSCGNWENSFQLISMNDGKMVQSIRQHRDVVTCIAVTPDGSILATGSYDTTVMVWEVCKTRGEKKGRPAQTDSHRKDYIVADSPCHILCGHDDVITCLYVSVELDIVISGSRDGTCIFHTLRDGRYVRSLCHQSGCALSKLVASSHGRIVFYSDEDLSLHLYSINGKHIATSESSGRLNCLELSCCGEFLVCAGDQGQIVVRSMNLLEIVGRYNGVGKVITALTVTPEECFLAGTKDGSLLVYSVENPQLRKPGIPPRNTKPKGLAI
uniref:BEACH domain-containing protein B n=1 Tax=Kalanchoe fedtschenkoi TaxID=63787 RepID=A0A7N0VH18_KALFE